MALNRSLASVVLGGFALWVASTQAQTAHVGDWTGSFSGVSGRAVNVHLKLAEKEGTWKTTGGGRDGCSGRNLPVAIESADSEQIVLLVEGSKVLAGCTSDKFTFKISGAEMQGALPDGRLLTLKRR